MTARTGANKKFQRPLRVVWLSTTGMPNSSNQRQMGYAYKQLLIICKTRTYGSRTHTYTTSNAFRCCITEYHHQQWIN